MSAPHDLAVTACKPVMRAMNDAMAAYLNGISRFHQMAVTATAETLALTTEIGKDIEAAKDVSDLMQLQAKLMRLWSEHGMQSWSRTWEALVANQSEAMRFGVERTAGLGKDLASAGNSQGFEMSPVANWLALLNASFRSAGAKTGEDAGSAATQKAAHGTATGEAHAGRRAH